LRRFTVERMKILPSLLILIDFAAGICYAFDGNWRKTIYWLAAGVLTITVTF